MLKNIKGYFIYYLNYSLVTIKQGDEQMVVDFAFLSLANQSTIDYFLEDNPFCRALDRVLEKGSRPFVGVNVDKEKNDLRWWQKWIVGNYIDNGNLAVADIQREEQYIYVFPSTAEIEEYKVSSKVHNIERKFQIVTVGKELWWVTNANQYNPEALEVAIECIGKTEWHSNFSEIMPVHVFDDRSNFGLAYRIRNPSTHNSLIEDSVMWAIGYGGHRPLKRG